MGIYSRRLMWGLSEHYPEARLSFFYRPNRYLRSFRQALPPNARRRLLIPALPATDVFHSLNQRVPPSRTRRLVVTFHDLFMFTDEYATPEFRERFTALARDAAERADVIIAVSEFTAHQVQHLLKVDARRVRVVHHGVDVPPASACTGKRENVVLHVGVVQRRKNTSRLVQAFSALPPSWRLVLAGSNGYGWEDTMKAIEASPARDRIEARGYVGEEELKRLYATSAILAFPSLDEGFGIPLLEAMSWRLPVLTSDRSALPEVAGDAAIVVDPLDTEQIAEGLRRLATDEWLRSDLIARGLKRAEEFSWEKAVRTTWGVYRELTA